nr:serine hydrolase [Oleiagrimonas soli]
MAQAASASSPVPRADHAWRTDVARYAQRMIDAGFFPGMQIAVTRGDRVVYTGSFGVADIGTGRRVDDGTRFYIASTTKALTATAVLLEIAHGRMSLDAPVTRYIHDVRFHPPLQAERITIRSLLAMTDGIDACMPVVFRTAFSGVFTQPQLIRLMRDCGPSKSGRAFVYRNLPYNLLGMALAPHARDGWKAVVRKDVLEPLGMRETTARVSTLARDRIAMPHEADGQGFARIRLAKTDANLHAAGGYFTTARDLARFLAVQASGGRLQGRRIFPAAVIATAHAEHAQQDRDFGPYHRYGWGYGWDLGRYEGHTLVHRFGAFSGYRSHVSFMPDTGVGVIVLVNGVGVPYAADEMADYIYDRLRDGHAKAQARHDADFARLLKRKASFARRVAAHRKLERQREREPLKQPLDAFVGRYANPWLGTMRWTLSDGHLHVAIGAAQSVATIYDANRSALRVELTGGGEVVRFDFGKGAKHATALEYHGYRFERVQ